MPFRKLQIIKKKKSLLEDIQVFLSICFCRYFLMIKPGYEGVRVESLPCAAAVGAECPPVPGRGTANAAGSASPMQIPTVVGGKGTK